MRIEESEGWLATAATDFFPRRSSKWRGPIPPVLFYARATV